jgi:hypothetical protein
MRLLGAHCLWWRMAFLSAPPSRQVSAAVRKIADVGITVALVLHQPRFEVFSRFDDLLLLGRGGRTVFWGRTSEAAP